MQRRTRLLLALATLLVPLIAGFLIWASTPLGPLPEAQQALQSTAEVQVETGRWLVFRPVGRQPTGGLIVYPGGRVSPAAYAPIARGVAGEGYLAVIVPMPLNLAILGIDRAAEVTRAFPAVTHWAVGGHSLGGAMAARFANRRPHLIQGLFLWGAYPASSDDLSGRALSVVVVYGTLDGLSTTDEVDASRRLLPPETTYVRIEGGNHAQFAWYGPQPGDKGATISRQAQQDQTLAATLDLLRGLSAPAP